MPTTSDEHISASEASATAVHKAQSAALAVEISRQVQLEETIQKTAEVTKASLLAGLKEVFGDGDEKDPNQMKVLVRRIPILCSSVDSMHKSLEKIESNQAWVVRIVLGAVILAVLKLVILG